MNRLLLLTLSLCSLAHATFGGNYEFYEPLSQYQADIGAINRKHPVRESQEYYSRMYQLYDSWEKNLSTMNFDALSQDGRVDYILFSQLLRKQKFLLNLNETEFKEVQSVTSFASDLYEFINHRHRGKNIDGQRLAQTFHTAHRELSTILEGLPKQKPYSTWQQADKAAQLVKSLSDNLEDAYNFYYSYHPAFTWWAEKPYAELKASLAAYQDKLGKHFDSTQQKDDGSGIIGRPEGREAMIRRLQFEYIPYTPEELIRIGEQELAFCHNEMRKASQEMGYGNDWRKALEHVKNLYVPAGEQPELIYRLANEAIAFLEERNLMTIPELAKETWRMQMMTPERQLVNPFFTGGEVISISYPTHTMAHDAKMMSLRGNNPHFCMATVHHELIPGHHMQGYMNQRHKPYRRPLASPFWLEGWALYWEFRFYELGLPQTPEDRMGFMFWRSHRAARIIFSLKYHLGQMTPQQCIDFLVSEVVHEYANAEAEVRRSFEGRYDPLYQMAYMIGGIQMEALKDELVNAGRMTEKEFHDRVMLENSMPIELLRALILEQPLNKDFKSSWMFYGKVPKK